MKSYLLAVFLSMPCLAFAQTPAASTDTQEVAVQFTGGHETEGEDRGRPVILVAAALKVPPEVFREAFSHVHPAPAGSAPEPDQVRKNKEALMNALAPYGVTNDRLDEVSNYYRYRRSSGEMWRNTPATATATISHGEVVKITITDPGAGYSSVPMISIPGVTQAYTAKLFFGEDLKKNGSVREIAAAPAGQ